MNSLFIKDKAGSREETDDGHTHQSVQLDEHWKGERVCRQYQNGDPKYNVDDGQKQQKLKIKTRIYRRR